MITGPKIYTEEGVIEHAVLHVEKNKIKGIERGKNIAAEESFIFPENYHLLPGFIDVHIHGANGSDVMDGTVSSLETISQALAKEGTTSYLATTMTALPDEIDQVLLTIADYKQKSNSLGATLLGAHLEGPFLSPKKVGAQRADQILEPDVQLVQRWQKKSGDAIKLITIAPELSHSLAMIEYLKRQHIVVAIGHTDATYAETTAAIEAGCSHVTHLFNAMRAIHQREPGVMIAALLSDKVTTELILDGVHVHPALVELTLKMKGKEKVMLVTDAMRAKCLPDGSYDLGGQMVDVKNSIARLADGTLAGSTLTMSDAVKNIMRFTRCDLTDVVKFAAENPAKMLNIFQRKGSIAPGKDADLVVLDDKFNVVFTLCEGRVGYQASEK